MARINPPLDVRIEVPAHLKEFLGNPEPKYKNARDRADKKALFFLRDEIKEAAPRGKTGDLKESITVDLRERTVFTKAVHARAIELGHYAEPVRTPKLMFLMFKNAAGEDAYPRFVRTEKKPYFFPALSKNRLRVIDIYENEYARMLKSI